MAAWHDRTSARDRWSDAKGLNDGELDDLLELTREACWLYVPRSTRAALVAAGTDPDVAPDEVPVRFRVAQLLHAQAVAQVPRTSSSSDTYGIDGFQTRVYVFGAEVRKVLVPPVYGELVG